MTLTIKVAYQMNCLTQQGGLAWPSPPNTSLAALFPTAAARLPSGFADKNLTWSEHLDYVCSKLNSGIYLLKMLSIVDIIKVKLMNYGTTFPELVMKQNYGPQELTLLPVEC